MSFRTAKARVTGLGSAGEGTHHWWVQRVSSIALIPLTLFFVPHFAGVLGEGHEAVQALYAKPFHAIVAALFMAVTFHHLQQGLQVVIEDYVHAKGWRTSLLLGNTFLCAVAGFASVFAILKLAFAG
ncbi:MAG: succinate dehydrogenase, hydrophobic membrane anchor protein [Paracoccaceae bacterium]